MLSPINNIQIYLNIKNLNTLNFIYMNAIEQDESGFGFHFNLLPPESLLGFKTINCEVRCKDEEWRALRGLEIGFLFFTLTFKYIPWK